ncbi:MAG: hypothetical protein LDL16_09650 [Thiobacillus sp.]|nr:hypothetical protein [Thiobacillus sp.]
MNPTLPALSFAALPCAIARAQHRQHLHARYRSTRCLQSRVAIPGAMGSRRM